MIVNKTRLKFELSKYCVDVIVATYCGSSFIAQQIKSIQNNKSYQRIVARVIVVDDGSTDNTLSVIEELMFHDNKIELHLNNGKTKGTSGNFEWGMNLSSAPYVMLCDQDDVWFDNKIELSLKKLLSLESNQPLLVFSDVEVVDEQLQPLSPSYFALKKFPVNWHDQFNQLLQQNVASGCTMIMNRALIEKSLPIPQGAFMHDWWLALVAKTHGRLVFIAEPTMLYRQHDSNLVGAAYRSSFKLLFNIPKYFSKFSSNFKKVVEQAKAFQQQYPNIQPELTLATLADIHYTKRWQRLYYCFIGRLSRNTLLGKLALILVLLTLPKIDTDTK